MKIKNKSLDNHKKSLHSKRSRKTLRKEKRKEKKARKNEYYTNRNSGGKYVKLPTKGMKRGKGEIVKEKNVKTLKERNEEALRNNNTLGSGNFNSTKKKPKDADEVEIVSKMVKREQKIKEELIKKMSAKRKKQMIAANEEEDKNIKKLEKLLKLNKRKSKSLPKSFTDDGLDYLLEICNPETMKLAAEAERELMETDQDFDEDFSLMTGEKSKKEKNKDESISSDEDFFSSEQDVDETVECSDENSTEYKNEDNDEIIYKHLDEEFNEKSDEDIDEKINEDIDEYNHKGSDKDIEAENLDENKTKQNDEIWEDIYGRLRNKDGDIIQQNQKYIPPALRAKMELGTAMDKKRLEKLNRLKKQLKGLLNRLAESNMHNISKQIEELYMNNSRNDMNETITNLILESLASNIITPERLLMEHVMLLAVLHANVGMEIGAHFLQSTVKKFQDIFDRDVKMEDKTLDNLTNILAQLYNFKVCSSQLIYQILEKLCGKFEEKNVECLLLILRGVGFSLRKDDPIALKNFILNVQKKINEVPEEMKENARVKFMFDILLAIKNNNVSKIPNYDITHSEHLKKILKGFIRRGNYITQLNISLGDLLKADEKGKWWVVGSAWSGHIEKEDKTNEKKDNEVGTFSQKLLDLARKQRMNTEMRKNIFCIIMSAEDYMDAFEKLLKLGLKNAQEREIIHVILHCCLKEKNYNPYYAVLAQKFCDYDRKYQMTIKYSVWDKLKALKDCSGTQLSNLAKLLTHLFLEKGLPISILKIVQFSELDKITLRFVRQILLGLLLCEDIEQCCGVFEKVALSDKLKMFRESLRLFIHHFLLKNLKIGAVSEENKLLLEQRAKIVEKVLMAGDKRTKF